MPDLDVALVALVLAAMVGCGTIGGVFFAFSAFVMRALAQLPPAQGIAAMQSINVVVLNPLFLGVFFCTAALGLVSVIVGALRWHDPRAMYLVGGGVLYLVGTLFVTIACNVPRNDALARIGPDDPGSADAWRRYVVGWTAWNHVRTAAALAAAAAFGVALAAG